MNVLIIEDHPFTATAYSNILYEDNTKNTIIVKALDCKQGYDAIVSARENAQHFDLAIIDYNLPSYREKNIFSGADLALLIRKNFESCKLIIITSHNEILIVYDLVRKINPDGLAIKSDINVDNLHDLFNDVINGKLYRSPQIKACVQEIWAKDFILDDYNRKILQYLAKGYRIKDLEKVVTLSSSAIHSRIIKLKKAFDAKDERDLIRKIFDEHYL